jgi:hypothetical protein
MRYKERSSLVRVGNHECLKPKVRDERSAKKMPQSKRLAKSSHLELRENFYQLSGVHCSERLADHI